jgi:hypothetical protein
VKEDHKDRDTSMKELLMAIQSQTFDELEKMHTKFSENTMLQQKDINIRLESILKEIKAPLDLE